LNELATDFVLGPSESWSFDYSLAVEVETVAGAVPRTVCAIEENFGAFMVIVLNLEILPNEVSPQVAPLSLAQVRPIRTAFAFRFQQRYRVSVQPRAGARSRR
jgi:hypothetical protein